MECGYGEPSVGDGVPDVPFRAVLFCLVGADDSVRPNRAAPPRWKAPLCKGSWQREALTEGLSSSGQSGNNPSGTAVPYHLPLHKGGYGRTPLSAQTARRADGTSRRRPLHTFNAPQAWLKLKTYRRGTKCGLKTPMLD